jgi:hypothetical protein
MAAPYWGQLPPPKVTRGNSFKRADEQMSKDNNNLTIDTSVPGERLSNQYYTRPRRESRQNRYSTQTDAPPISTQSPFASPIASEFPRGLITRTLSKKEDGGRVGEIKFMTNHPRYLHLLCPMHRDLLRQSATNNHTSTGRLWPRTPVPDGQDPHESLKGL